MNEEEILDILGKKYAFKILKLLENRPRQRFKDIYDACPIEKMGTRRLRELEDLGFIKVDVDRIGRKHVSIYSISEKGKLLLKILNELKKL